LHGFVLPSLRFLVRYADISCISDTTFDLYGYIYPKVCVYIIGLQFSIRICLAPVLFVTSIHCLHTHTQRLSINSCDSLDAFHLYRDTMTITSRDLVTSLVIADYRIDHPVGLHALSL